VAPCFILEALKYFAPVFFLKMFHERRKILSIIFPILILLVSPAAIVAATASTTAASGSGMRPSLPFYSVYYSSSMSSPQPSPYCQTGLGVIVCYTPQDIKRAYNYPNYLDGTGQTIVIVDAFGSPTVQSDLNTFDSTFGLPPTTIQIVCQGGTCPTGVPSNGDQLSWTEEIALDTQYAHAMAPGAHIVLFVATSDDDLVLEQAVLQAVKEFPHSIISQSFGDPEQDLQDGTCTLTPGLCTPAYVQQVLSTGEAAYALAAIKGDTVFASAGDYGADNSPLGFTEANPSYPSSSPWVTAVGGTMGNPYSLPVVPSCSGRICSTGLVTFLNTASCQLNALPPYTTAPSCTPVGYGAEQVWNEKLLGIATGGAPSLYFPVPLYQLGLGLTSRTTPDVSYNAAVDGGVFGYWTAGESFVPPVKGGFYIFGGTSAGSPQWSAIAALADQLAMQDHRGTIGFINPTLYLIGHNSFLYNRDFHDITVGNNIVAGSTIGFSAQRGWDDASGWGTPNVANLVPDLVQLSL